LIPTFPGGAKGPSGSHVPGPAAWPAAGAMPSQVRLAARLMYAGAVLGAGGLLYYGFHTKPTSAPQVVHIGNPRTAAYGAGFVAGGILLAAIAAGLWLWLAWAVRRGRPWARIVSTVLFGLGGLRLLAGLLTNPTSVVTICWALSWLAGLTAIVLLFQRPSSAFFSSAGVRPPQSGHPAPPGYARPYDQAPQFPPHDQAPS
jgi:hypothetical protein